MSGSGVAMMLDTEARAAMAAEMQAEKLEDVVPEQEPTTERGFGIDLSFLTAKTGPGSVSDYVDHPLNFSHGEGLAQVLRGATGMLGELDLAIVDIGIGSFRMAREGKGKKVTENAPER